MEVQEPRDPLPQRYVEALAEESFAEWEQERRRKSSDAIETSALAALRGYAWLLEDAGPDEPGTAGWKIRVGRLRAYLGDVDGGLSLIGEVMMSAERPRPLADLASVVPDLFHAGDLEAAAALAADVLCRSSADAVDPDALRAAMSSALRRVARLDPSVASEALETAVHAAQAAVAAPHAIEPPAVRAERTHRALGDLAAGLRALADAHEAGGRVERASELRTGAQHVIGSRVFGAGVRATFRGAAMDLVEEAFDRRSVDDGAAFSRAAAGHAASDPFDAAIARMYAAVLGASRDRDGAAASLTEAREARAEARRELARAFRAGEARPLVGGSIDDVAEEEVDALYIEALTRAVPRAAEQAADVLVGEGELVLGLRPALTSCLTDRPDALRRWAKELVALDDRLERCHGPTALGAILRAKELDASGPSASADPDEVDELLVRVVGDIVESAGLEAVRQHLDERAAEELTLADPDTLAVWDRLRGNVEEAAVASGVLPAGATPGLLGRALQHYTAALAPDVDASERAEPLALEAWDRLAGDPVVAGRVAPCVVELGDRLAERDADAEVAPGRIEVLGVALARLRTSTHADDPDRIEAELVLRGQAVRAAWADLVAGGSVGGSVAQLVRHGLVDVAAEVAEELSGGARDEVLAATEHAAAIVLGEPDDARRAVDWARAAARDGATTAGAVIEAALRASPLRAALLAEVPEAAGSSLGVDRTDWDAAAQRLIEDLGPEDDVELGAGGEQDVSPSDIDTSHGRSRGGDGWAQPDEHAPGPQDGPDRADGPDEDLGGGDLDL